MKKILLFTAALMVLSGCESAPPLKQEEARKPAAVDCSAIPAMKNGQAWDANDPTLKCGDLTVQKLQDMARAAQTSGDFSELNKLFNNGVSLNSLPTGYSAGKGVPFPVAKLNTLNLLLEAITGDHWRGKIFFAGTATESHGLNRISPLRKIGAPFRKYRPMAAFKTYLLTPDNLQGVFTQPGLVKDARSSFVALNYALPVTGGGDSPLEKFDVAFIEGILARNIPFVSPVFDVMVAVPGKNGPVYVGKTWVGKYDKKKQRTPFTATNPDQLIAYYFLDFNQATVDEQMPNWNDEVQQDLHKN
jgi:hypothetical protein